MVIDAHLHLWDTERLPYPCLRRPENAATGRWPSSAAVTSR